MRTFITSAISGKSFYNELSRKYLIIASFRTISKNGIFQAFASNWESNQIDNFQLSSDPLTQCIHFALKSTLFRFNNV